MILNVLSDGMGRWWFGVIDLLLKISFPGIIVNHDSSKEPDLVVRGHFRCQEALDFSCPYIMWSAEARRVPKYKGIEPIIEINSFDCDDPKSVYYPLLVLDSKTQRSSQQAEDKKYCCAYAFSNKVLTRENLFQSMHKLEKTCYGFGPSCQTNNNPFELPRSNRFENSKAFKDFGFVVALENEQKQGYFTEKIGMAFESGSVPIYNSSNGIDRFINRESYFDVSSYENTEAAGIAAVEIWKDKQKLQKYLDAPVRVNDNLAQYENIDVNESRVWMNPIINTFRENLIH